ncbi:hypothetical protein TBLA_0A05060 [Henningerozyma blattae CBS 6284]|uniref:Autophagy-related protein n=1 Tax=Henningerozyma blattae (strain ATCC 34711 / CBS 6284 / DSM 70876 / NBRC 10599 / NRRL Y-10934 / UCD 77-7) TaxID=1071380 RepID=I2GVZ7_HENB6|nr:hypothetical protein TBLA_0A05060 [Tetrapisispora blattae CBS 6284]CCH58299.1 hypothetical protein TBLA_0A05060 [Tetrapisispora blattae CBS 6284]
MSDGIIRSTDARQAYGTFQNEQDEQNNTQSSSTNRSSQLELLKSHELAKRNIYGWFFYSFSSEPFVVSAIATYIPLLLEQFARESGVQLHDHSIPCSNNDDKCVLGLFNNLLYVDTSSFALYTFSVSVFVQTIIVITVSGFVDMWKTVRIKCIMLLLFGLIGSFATIFISQLNNTQYYMLALCCIISNSCYGVVNVVGNSLLPTFASDLVNTDIAPTNSVANSSTSENTLPSRNIDTMTTVISGRGASLGYCAALIVQIVSMALVKKINSDRDLQIAAYFVGLWWLFWQIPMYWLMNDLPSINRNNVRSVSNFNISRKRHTWRKRISYMKYGWLSLFDALKNARLLKDVVIFLIGWFIVSDSLTTINSTAILFSKTELKMSTVQLIIVSILTMINAMLGAFFVPHLIATKLRIAPERMLLVIICWSSFIPFYGILGFIFQSFGLKHQFEMYFMAIWYGISLGSIAAVSRSVFSLIIPRGRESTFFSLFNVTDKGSSILGPFLIGLITDKTHNIRYSFYLLFVLIMASLPIFNLLNVSRAKEEAEELRRIELGGEISEDDPSDIPLITP